MKKLIFLFSLLCSQFALAQSAYVTDQFKITLRSGESSSHRILAMVPTGSKLKVLSRNDKSGYSHVRTSNGKEGYVLNRQLLNQPVARERLAALEAEMDALKAAPGELRGQLAGLTREHVTLKAAHKELDAIKRDIEQELAALKRSAANAVRITNERNELRKQSAKLTREVENLKQKNRELENSEAQSWFMIGAAVLFGGMILGLILPHLRLQRRKSSWGSL